MARSSSKIVFLLSRISPEEAVAVHEVDPWDLVETVREGLLVLELRSDHPLREPFLLRHIRSRARGCGWPEAL